MHMLGKIIGVVKMNYSLFVSLDYIVVKQKPFCNILAYLACHIIALNAVYSGVLI